MSNAPPAANRPPAVWQSLPLIPRGSHALQAARHCIEDQTRRHRPGQGDRATARGAHPAPAPVPRSPPVPPRLNRPSHYWSPPPPARRAAARSGSDRRGRPRPASPPGGRYRRTADVVQSPRWRAECAAPTPASNTRGVSLPARRRPVQAARPRRGHKGRRRWCGASPERPRLAVRRAGGDAAYPGPGGSTAARRGENPAPPAAHQAPAQPPPQPPPTRPGRCRRRAGRSGRKHVHKHPDPGRLRPARNRRRGGSGAHKTSKSRCLGPFQTAADP